MPSPKPALLGVSLVALLAAACARSSAHADTGPADAGPLVRDAAATPPRQTIAPLMDYGGNLRSAFVATEDPRWPKDDGATVSLDGSFVLEVAMGGFPDGFNVTTLHASGRASHFYEVREKQKSLAQGRLRRGARGASSAW